MVQELVKKSRAELNRELINKYRETGDKQYRDELFEENDKLCWHVAHKYHKTTSMQVDELAALARYGMLKAFNSFDPDKGYQFATYSMRCMNNEILMALRKEKKHQGTISMEYTIYSDKDGSEITIEDFQESQEAAEAFEEVIQQEYVQELLERVQGQLVSDLERTVFENILLVDGEGGRKSQPALAKELGFSQSYISRVAGRIYGLARKTAEAMKKEEDEEACNMQRELELRAKVDMSKLNGKTLMEQVEYIMKIQPQMPARDIAVLTRRNSNSITTYMSMIRKKWSEEQDELAKSLTKEPEQAPKPMRHASDLVPPARKPEPSEELKMITKMVEVFEGTPEARWEEKDLKKTEPDVRPEAPQTEPDTKAPALAMEVPEEKVLPKAKPPRSLSISFDSVDIDQILHFLEPYRGMGEGFHVTLNVVGNEPEPRYNESGD